MSATKITADVTASANALTRKEAQNAVIVRLGGSTMDLLPAKVSHSNEFVCWSIAVLAIDEG